MDTAKSVALFHDAGEIHWKEVFSKYSSPSAVYELPGKSVLPVITPYQQLQETGSELTAMIISDQENNDKECVYHQAVFPRVAIIDPELCRTLPPYPTAITGFDAFTHSFESYVRELASPYTMLLGKEAMRTIIQVLPKLVKDTFQYGIQEVYIKGHLHFPGISSDNASATIPHPLSEVIGGVG